jgi:hypothetical protein
VSNMIEAIRSGYFWERTAERAFKTFFRHWWPASGRVR